MRLVEKDVIERAATDEEVEMTAVRMPEPVAVIHQHVNSAIGRSFLVGALHFRNTEFEMVKIDVRAAAVFAEEPPAHILPIPVRARGGGRCLVTICGDGI